MHTADEVYAAFPGGQQIEGANYSAGGGLFFNMSNGKVVEMCIESPSNYTFLGVGVNDTEEQATSKLAALGYTTYSEDEWSGAPWLDAQSGDKELNIHEIVFSKNYDITIRWGRDPVTNEVQKVQIWASSEG